MCPYHCCREWHYRGHLPQALQDCRCTDVPGMHDDVTTPERRKRLGTEESMRVRDQAHHGLSSAHRVPSASQYSARSTDTVSLSPKCSVLPVPPGCPFGNSSLAAGAPFILNFHHIAVGIGYVSVPEGIVNLKITKCEMAQYKALDKIITAICCSHVRL